MAVLVSVASLMLAGCGPSTSTGGDGTDIDDLVARLDRVKCENRLDDLAFEIDGLIFESDSLEIDLEAIESSIPDTLLVCPATGSMYLFEFNDELEITCPEGHGTVSVDL